MKWQTKIVQIESADLQWDGSEESEAVIRAFAPAEYLEFGEIETNPSIPYLRVYNVLEHQWLNVPIGHWVVKGLKGEFYPCEPEAMDKKYFEVEEEVDRVDAVDIVKLIDSLKTIGGTLSGDEYVYTSEMIDFGNYLVELAKKIERYGIK